VLVGRDRELRAIDEVLAGLSSGTGALLLFSGEPGIGKTCLASEAVQRARVAGIKVAWGHCWEAGGAPAMWPWREALPALGVPFPDQVVASADPAATRFALFREVANVLGPACPCLVVLEDLHAADLATALLLEFLATQLRSLPLAVIGTFREVEVSLQRDLSAVIGRASRAARVLKLARLDEADVGALVRDAIERADDRLVSTVFQTTLGNPLFVDEIVREVRAGRDHERIPLGVREVIRQRLSLASAETHRVLEAAATFGVELSGADLAHIVAGAANRLDDATRSGLIGVRGDRVRFAHALYREALYHDLPRERRCELHAAAARTLAARGAPLSEVAHHLLECGDPTAIDHAIRAAYSALASFAFEDAEALLERARAAIAPGPQAEAQRCRVKIALGEVRIRSGDAGGRALCVEAARVARELRDAELLALAGLAYGTVLVMGGVDPTLVAMLEEALAGLPAETSLRARAMARLATARQPTLPANRERDIQLGFDAVELARRVCEPHDLIEVLHHVSGVIYGAVEPPIRISIMRELEGLAGEHGDVTRVLAARSRIAIDHLEMGDFASHARLADSYEQLAQRFGPAAAPWRVPLMRSMHAIVAGDYARSEQLQEEARRLAYDQPRARRAIAMHRICFLAAAERHTELRAALPELRGLWLEMPYAKYLVDARVASMLARIGAEDEVRALLRTLPGEVYEEGINTVWLIDAHWLTGDVVHAHALEAELAVNRWMMYWFDCEIVLAPSTRSGAYLAALVGKWDECDRLFARALGEVEALGMRALAARMRFELGDLMVRRDREPARARELVSDARAAAAALRLHDLVGLIDRRHPRGEARPGVAPPVAPAPARAFALVLEGEYYAVAGAREPIRLKASRGLQYLARLIEQPNVELHVLDLVGSSDADRGDAGELVDAGALRAYRARLEALRDRAEQAEMLGDSDAAADAREEMEAIAAELARSTGKGGKPRRAESAVDRARSAVQRRIKDAIDRIEARDGALGKWLRRAVRTGNTCTFRPDD
jgi:hypothetical protein